MFTLLDNSDLSCYKKDNVNYIMTNEVAEDEDVIAGDKMAESAKTRTLYLEEKFKDASGEVRRGVTMTNAFRKYNLCIET